MRPPNLTEAARVTRRLLDQYGPARLLRVEELAPGIFRGDAGRRGPGPGSGPGGRTDRRPGGRAVGIKNPRGLSAPGAVDRGSTDENEMYYTMGTCV